jgi:hypothetical protein
VLPKTRLKAGFFFHDLRSQHIKVRVRIEILEIELAFRQLAIALDFKDEGRRVKTNVEAFKALDRRATGWGRASHSILSRAFKFLVETITPIEGCGVNSHVTPFTFSVKMDWGGYITRKIVSVYYSTFTRPGRSLPGSKYTATPITMYRFMGRNQHDARTYQY